MTCQFPPPSASGDTGLARDAMRAVAVAAAAMAAMDAAAAHQARRVPSTAAVPRRQRRAVHAVRALPLGIAMGLSMIGCTTPPVVATVPAIRNSTVVPVLATGTDQVRMDAAACYTAGKNALDLGHFAVALAYFDRAATLRPGWPEAEGGRIVALARLGRSNDAMQAAQLAITAGPHTPSPDDAAATPLTAEPRVEMLPMPKSAAPSVPLAAVVTAPPLAAPRSLSAIDPNAPQRLSWVRSGPGMLELKMDAASVVAVLPSQPAASPTPGIVAMAALRMTTTMPPAASPAPVVVAVKPRTGAAVAALKLDAAASVPARSAVTEPAATVVLASAAPASALRMTIEISNGAGRSGLAKGTALALQSAGMTARRLTNHSNFKVQHTEIQYRTASDAAAAIELAKSFAWKVAVVVNPNLRGDVNVRVVLGHDAAAMKGKVCCAAAVTAHS